MKIRMGIVFIAVCFLSLAITGSLFGAEKGKEAASGGEIRKDSPPKDIFIHYKPPRLGKPGSRVGGGTRGAADESPVVVALVPDRGGLASTPRPVLCWYLSRPMDMRIEIVLNDESTIKPVLEKQLTMPDRGGIHCLKLAEHNIGLRQGTEYQWFVAVIPDPRSRSKDIVSGGTVMYREPEATLAARLKGLAGTEAAALYADEGLWYDSLWRLIEMAGKEQTRPGAQKMLRALLEQVGLAEVASTVTR